MPTSSLKPAMMANPMALSYPASYRPDMVLIHCLSYQACGNEIGGVAGTAVWASNTYPSASRILAFPFALAESYLVRKVWWYNGTTATTDSADVGVFTEDGATKLVSSGSTAIATANVLQEVDVTDTLLTPGRYWCAYIQGGVTATPFCIVLAANAGVARAIGVAEQSGSGSTLGSTFTPAALSSTTFPIFGIAARTQVA